MAREITLSRGRAAIVDDADFDWLSRWKWCVNSNGYAVRKRSRADAPGGGLVLMHRAVAQAPAAISVDHINRDRLDNRRANLRLCTQAENSRNRGLMVSNATGFKGVVAEPETGRFHARLRFEDEVHVSRRFTTAIGAALAYDSMAREFHGEFAGLNFPDMAMEWPWRAGPGAKIAPTRKDTLKALASVPRRVQRPDLADDLIVRLAKMSPGDEAIEDLILAARDAVYGPLRAAA